MPLREPSLKTGDLFQNQYLISGILGAGGHAFVYRAEDQILGREVALKLIEISASSARDRRRRARNEARVLTRLLHPNVVRVFGAGATDDGFVYLVMEVLEGQSLRQVLQRLRTLSIAEALSVGAQIADGAQAAHEAGTIHRDLKPDNVFVGPGNAVHIIDFGVAKLVGAHAQTTQRDLVHGTVYYMSPEHLQGFSVTPQSDVFALGVLLYEALAGIRPVSVGIKEVNPNAIIHRQLNVMPPPLDEMRPDVPAFVARTIQRMLAKRAADRPASMTEVAALLRDNLARWRAEAPGAAAVERELVAVRSVLEPMRVGSDETTRSSILALRPAGLSTTRPFVTGSALLASAAAPTGEERLSREITPVVPPGPSERDGMRSKVEQSAASALPSVVIHPDVAREGYVATTRERAVPPERRVQTRSAPVVSARAVGKVRESDSVSAAAVSATGRAPAPARQSSIIAAGVITGCVLGSLIATSALLIQPDPASARAPSAVPTAERKAPNAVNTPEPPHVQSAASAKAAGVAVQPAKAVKDAVAARTPTSAARRTAPAASAKTGTKTVHPRITKSRPHTTSALDDDLFAPTSDPSPSPLLAEPLVPPDNGAPVDTRHASTRARRGELN